MIIQLGTHHHHRCPVATWKKWLLVHCCHENRYNPYCCSCLLEVDRFVDGTVGSWTSKQEASPLLYSLQSDMFSLVWGWEDKMNNGWMRQKTRSTFSPLCSENVWISTVQMEENQRFKWTSAASDRMHNWIIIWNWRQNKLVKDRT